ncbi:hypothetical protein H2198_006649 [Neophaeococcomyces mojaviensis]|uniref:Uncharacterized protein n=1 Tax=Neophaeococcomyces mojaviensis TaxID=3383035 RepID=A0ACC3A2V8_9EURO|nr:hypothetical protein H2198_006649 [Knufia sp. JES_112]
MAAQAETLQLVRFLTQDCKVALARALPKCSTLRQKGLNTIDDVAHADLDMLKTIFEEEKVAKQVLNAAKKKSSNSRKRAAPEGFSDPVKRVKGVANDEEADLVLPLSQLSIDELRLKTIETNRAPLFLAFAVTLAKYTLSDQPLSSRLSLAQAVTSAGAQSKAKYIGLTSSTPEDEGWAQGQPKIKLMGREIAVMRRQIAVPAISAESGSQKTVENDSGTSHEAFWGIDLEALKKSNGPLVAGKMSGSAGPPIHTPQAARAYLFKSIDLIETGNAVSTGLRIKSEETDSPKKVKKPTSAERMSRRENAVAMLLTAIDHVCQSWSLTLSSEELDRRAGAWYAKVRPDVEYGQAGWGQRGQVPLRAILDLTKDS